MLGASSYHVKPNGLEAMRRQLKVLHDYWLTCEVPEVDSTGKRLETDSRGKLGERFAEADLPKSSASRPTDISPKSPELNQNGTPATQPEKDSETVLLVEEDGKRHLFL
jgi:hypothetical protein